MHTRLSLRAFVATVVILLSMAGCVSPQKSTSARNTKVSSSAQPPKSKISKAERKELLLELKELTAPDRLAILMEEIAAATPVSPPVEGATPAAGIPRTSLPTGTDATTATGPGTAAETGTRTATDTAQTPSSVTAQAVAGVPLDLKRLPTYEGAKLELSKPQDTQLIFDIPVTYNARVRQWIKYFQGNGRSQLRTWMQRSARFLPIIQYELSRAGLPQDLVYIPMIESGFSPRAVSHANAMGMWQFISPTARRYGLKIDWWLDERCDFHKSTRAAIAYMSDLYRLFGSWYLVAASYNMGEGGVKRLIKRHKTNNFWTLADMGVLPEETKNYVPKIIAAMLISKAPALYGFRDLTYDMPHSYEYFYAPGGTDVESLARYIGVKEKYLKDLNPELLKGIVPRHVTTHKIRIPKGSLITVSQYIRLREGTAIQ